MASTTDPLNNHHLPIIYRGEDLGPVKSEAVAKSAQWRCYPQKLIKGGWKIRDNPRTIVCSFNAPIEENDPDNTKWSCYLKLGTGDENPTPVDGLALSGHICPLPDPKDTSTKRLLMAWPVNEMWESDFFFVNRRTQVPYRIVIECDYEGKTVFTTAGWTFIIDPTSTELSSTDWALMGKLLPLHFVSA